MNEIPTCLPPDRHPRPPAFAVPAGSVDTHVHVFDGRYPLVPDRSYNPPDSTVNDLRQLHSTLGFDRVVITQPSAYGRDNSAILDALQALNAETPDRARAVVTVGPDISNADLKRLDELGVRGIRINTDNRGAAPLQLADVPELCTRIARLGWHLEFLFPGRDIVELTPFLTRLPVPISLSHFAYQQATDGVSGHGFQALLKLMERGNTWMKLSGANRVSATGLPPYDDLAPMAEALIAVAPNRLLWGSDWPHPNKFDVIPNDGDLLDAFGTWVPDEALRKAILVDTPEAFYRFWKI